MIYPYNGLSYSERYKRSGPMEGGDPTASFKPLDLHQSSGIYVILLQFFHGSTVNNVARPPVDDRCMLRRYDEYEALMP